jgi:hypothetical protein
VLGAANSAVVQVANCSMDTTDMIMCAEIEANRQMNDYHQMFNEQPDARGERGGCRAGGWQFWSGHENATVDRDRSGKFLRTTL